MELVDVLFSTADRRELLTVLDLYEKQTYAATTDIPESPYSAFLAQVIAAASDRERALATTREQALAMPIIRLTLAYEPSAEFIRTLARTVRSVEENAGALVDIEVDPSLIAGVQVSSAGKLRDLSLAKQLQTMDLAPLIRTHLQYAATST